MNNLKDLVAKVEDTQTETFQDQETQEAAFQVWQESL